MQAMHSAKSFIKKKFRPAESRFTNAGKSSARGYSVLSWISHAGDRQDWTTQNFSDPLAASANR